MIEKTWQEYKNKKNKTVSPIKLLNKNNYIDEQIAKNRMQICDICPSLIPIIKQCKECGCIMPLKTKLLQAECPLKKW